MGKAHSQKEALAKGGYGTADRKPEAHSSFR
jgi:hypothetical protein